MKTFMVRRVLAAADGRGSWVLNVKGFEDLEDAKAFCQQQSGLMEKLATCKLVAPNGEDMRLTAGEFMGEVGVVGFASFVDVVEIVQHSLIAKPPAGFSVR